MKISSDYFMVMEIKLVRAMRQIGQPEFPDNWKNPFKKKKTEKKITEEDPGVKGKKLFKGFFSRSGTPFESWVGS